MAKFIETDNGMINLDTVTRAVTHTTEKNGKFRIDSTTLKFKDGSSITEDGDLTEWIRKGTAPFVPASPGYQIVVLATEKEAMDSPPEVVWREPVIAWRIEHGVFTHPVTLDHEWESTEQPVGTLCPDGRVIVLGCCHDSIEAWARAVADERKAEKATVTPIKRNKAAG